MRWRLLVKGEILPSDVNEMRFATADHIKGARQPLTKLKKKYHFESIEAK